MPCQSCKQLESKKGNPTVPHDLKCPKSRKASMVKREKVLSTLSTSCPACIQKATKSGNSTKPHSKDCLVKRAYNKREGGAKKVSPKKAVKKTSPKKAAKTSPKKKA